MRMIISIKVQFIDKGDKGLSLIVAVNYLKSIRSVYLCYSRNLSPPAIYIFRGTIFQFLVLTMSARF